MTPVGPDETNTGNERCAVILSSRNQCGRDSRYYVNGFHSCSRHLEKSIRFHSVANTQGHLWVSVQILERSKK